MECPYQMEVRESATDFVREFLIGRELSEPATGLLVTIIRHQPQAWAEARRLGPLPQEPWDPAIRHASKLHGVSPLH